ncbi:MAG: CdaR family protein [Leptospirillia bacterium]
MTGRWEALSRSLMGNLPIKILALVLSLFLWYHISRTGNEYLTLTLPVTVTNLPPHLELNRATPDHVTVTLKGPPGMGSQIRPERLTILLDGHNFRPGRTNLLLESGNVALPSGIRVIHFSPSSLSLRILPLGRREIPIVPQFIGETRDRIAPIRIHVVPRQALVEGDRTLLSTISFIKTQPIELKRLSDSKLQTLSISLASPDPTRVRILSPRKVTIEIERSSRRR